LISNPRNRNCRQQKESVDSDKPDVSKITILFYCLFGISSPANLCSLPSSPDPAEQQHVVVSFSFSVVGPDRVGGAAVDRLPPPPRGEALPHQGTPNIFILFLFYFILL
jgi:hypothetical protein